MTDTSEPTLSWTDAPEKFRAAHERQNQELETLRTEAAQSAVLARKVVMLEAGVDMGHPAAEYFVAGYTGKDEIDDVKAAWEKIAGSATPPPTTPPTTPPPPNDDGTDPTVAAQLADLQRQQAALGGSSTPPGEEPTPDPQTQMHLDNAHWKSVGRNREQAMNLSLDGLFEKAVAGDLRIVSSNPIDAARKWREKNGFE